MEERHSSHTSDERRSSDEADAIQQDIHRTRERIDETIDAVKHQLAPGELIDQLMSWFRSSGAGSKVGSKAGDMLSSVGRTIKENPIPAALIGIGLIGLASNGRSKSEGVGGEAKSTEGSMGATAEKLEHKVEHLTGEARESIERGYQKVRQRVEDDPIVLGALGIALGAALGAGLPRTRLEDQTFGEKRDELASKAKQVAEQVRQGARQVVDEAAEAVAGH